MLWPLVWLRDRIQASGQPVWIDFAITAVVVSALTFYFSRSLRPLLTCVATFAGIALVIAVMGLDRGGLPVVDTTLWGGLLVTLVISVTGIVASMPIGIALALGRRSTIPLDPLLLDRLHRVLARRAADHGAVLCDLHAAAVPARQFHRGWPGARADRHRAVCRGLPGRGRQGRPAAIPRGQGEAASALGLSWAKTTFLIVLPQALRHVIPGLVNSFIALFKDTSLVSIVALFDLLGSLRASFSDPNWATPTTLFTGFAFTGIIYFTFCFGMSRYSLFVENRLNAHRRN